MPSHFHDVFMCSSAPDAEVTIGREYDACVPVGELPSRALLECAVFAEDAERGGRLIMQDLQCLDAEPATPLDVVGRVALMSEDGNPIPNASPGNSCAHSRRPVCSTDQSVSPIHHAGPLIRLCGVTEWSVEYDELAVTVWVSTSVADYKLVSAAPLYKPIWKVSAGSWIATSPF